MSSGSAEAKDAVKEHGVGSKKAPRKKPELDIDPKDLAELRQAFQSRRYRLTLLEPMLGTVPTSKDLFTRFVAEKAGLEPEEVAVEAEMVPEDKNEKGQAGYTSFYRDADGIYLFDYHIKGFLKEAGQVLKDVLKVAALRSKLDNFCFVMPRYIHLQEEPDGCLERPLRAQTMQGPRVALAKSDFVDPGRSFEVEIVLLPHHELNYKLIELLLDYGRLKGLGQFRNGSYGRFSWERLGRGHAKRCTG
ncbi:MAG: hypothetical protein C4567_18755 [Deltaproteobacteria bacterium]|nr:MAG: hypothetical protein C4567_18755 [Deltaproteobacteria bacterium]